MADEIAKRFDWRLSTYGIAGALVVAFPTLILGNDIGTFLITVLIAALVSLVLLVIAVRAIRSRSLAVMLMLLVYCAVSWLLFKTSNEMRYAGRWLFRSEHYKSLALDQPAPRSREFQHIEWDGWGFAGSGDTTVYLVFDPGETLKKEMKLRSSGKFSGIPCKVFKIQRLDDHWFSAHFYTDDSWNYCN